MRDRVLKRLFLRYRAKGDGRALAAVFDRTARELLQLAAHLVPGTGEAEDLVQLTFLRVMERAPHFDAEREFLPWLHGILWREAAALRRRRGRSSPRERGTGIQGAVDRLESAGNDPAEQLAARELPEAVGSALAGLPSPYREVVEPFLLAERAPHEIAAALGRAPGTVRVQLQRGLERLRRKLPREHASFGLLAGTRGLGGLRAALLEELGVTSGAGPLATHALFAWTALAATPLLWPVPIAASVATLALARPETFSWLSTALATGAPAPTLEPAPAEDPMKTALLVPLAVLTASPTQDQREPVVTESVAEKVAALDTLVGELLVLSQPGQTDADAAWAGLMRARNRITEEERTRARANQASNSASWSQSQAWTQAIEQLDDPAQRAQALREIETALVSGTPEMQLAACRTLSACGQVEFDKTPFRPLLLPLARDARGALHTAALYALYNTVHLPEDRALALALADDPSNEAREQGPHLVLMYCERDLTGDGGAAVARMFTGSTYSQRRSMLSGIWGAHVSPELENVVLELSRSQSSEDRYDAMYYSLSTFDPKSEAVVQRLVEFLPSTDPNIYQRVLWGLSYGIEPAQGPMVLAAARSLFEARSDASIQSECLGLVGQHAGPELAPWLQSIADDARRLAAVREAAREALSQVNAR